MSVIAIGFALVAVALPVMLNNGFSLSSLPLPFLQDSPPPLAPLFVLTDSEAQRLEGTADGDEAAQQVANLTCAGYLQSEPDVRVQTPRAGVVHLDVAGTGDLTLAVLLSDGRWVCDDDSGSSLLPRIVEHFPVGVHQVYVGRFSRSQPEPFALTVSEDMPELPRPEVSVDDKPDESEPPRRRHRRRSSMRQTSMNHASMSHASTSSEPAEEATLPVVGAIPVGPTPHVSESATRGMLSINTTPWSTVRINGRIVGNTPRTNLIVPVGNVRVDVQREGHGPWETLSVVVRAGHPARIQHQF